MPNFCRVYTPSFTVQGSELGDRSYVNDAVIETEFPGGTNYWGSNSVGNITNTITWEFLTCTVNLVTSYIYLTNGTNTIELYYSGEWHEVASQTEPGTSHNWNFAASEVWYGVTKARFTVRGTSDVSVAYISECEVWGEETPGSVIYVNNG
jgi:hypothetical protein